MKRKFKARDKDVGDFKGSVSQRERRRLPLHQSPVSSLHCTRLMVTAMENRVLEKDILPMMKQQNTQKVRGLGYKPHIHPNPERNLFGYYMPMGLNPEHSQFQDPCLIFWVWVLWAFRYLETDFIERSSQ